MRQIQINPSALLQGGIGSALVGASVLLWTTLSDLNRAVAKLDATVQVSNAAVTVLKEEIRDMKQQQKDQDRARLQSLSCHAMRTAKRMKPWF